MYHCEITGKLSKLGEPLHKVVIATRSRTYTKWVRDEETNKWTEVVVSKGFETVKELLCTADGEAEWNAWDNDQRWLFIKNYYPHLIKAAEEAEDAIQLEAVRGG
jgi:hypothetical protein